MKNSLSIHCSLQVLKAEERWARERSRRCCVGTPALACSPNLLNCPGTGPGHLARPHISTPWAGMVALPPAPSSGGKTGRCQLGIQLVFPTTFRAPPDCLEGKPLQDLALPEPIKS